MRLRWRLTRATRTKRRLEHSAPARNAITASWRARARNLRNQRFCWPTKYRVKIMASPILVTGAAGSVGAVGRAVTELLLKQGNAVRAMVRSEDERAQALRDKGAEVVVGDLLDLDSMHNAIAGCETLYFGMSVSD